MEARLTDGTIIKFDTRTQTPIEVVNIAGRRINLKYFEGFYLETHIEYFDIDDIDYYVNQLREMERTLIEANQTIIK